MGCIFSCHSFDNFDIFYSGLDNGYQIKIFFKDERQLTLFVP